MSALADPRDVGSRCADPTYETAQQKIGLKMKLQMQDEKGAPETLPQNDNILDTGPMGDCVSVIVLCHYQPASSRYLDVRGWHGLGGIQVIDMNAMMRNVNDAETTQVIIIAGSLQFTDFAEEINREHVKAGLNSHPNVKVLYISACSQATVDRQGLVKQNKA